MKRISPSRDVRATHSPDGAVLIDVRQGIIFSLNTTGSIVWMRLERGEAPDEIAGQLSDEFGVSQDQALQDILALIRTLEDRQLLVPAA